MGFCGWNWLGLVSGDVVGRVVLVVVCSDMVEGVAIRLNTNLINSETSNYLLFSVKFVCL